MKIVAIIQARFGSERLPGKVLKDIAGEPMLARVVNRIQRASALDDIVIATTESVLDDVISELCFDRTDDLPNLRSDGRFLKRRNHFARPKPTKITTK